MYKNDSQMFAFTEFKIPHAKLAGKHADDFQDDLSSGFSNGGSKVNVDAISSPKDNRAVFQTTQPVTYTWKNLTVDVTVVEGSLLKRNRNSFRKRILDNASGAVRPGEFVAIMGASGAGKTTLLNCLTFRNGQSLKITGERRLNGAPVSKNILARISGYVQQDDLFIGSMKVWEVLRFQALLRMDKHFTDGQRMERVEEVIQEFGLTKCRNTLIGMPEKGIKGISGGERKRLAFACEVLSNPSLMFCDEPTSGLDSFMAQNVVQALKSMASAGKTVICTIHQPSSEVFALFDRILLMADGRTAFLGPISEALEFFTDLGMPCPSNFNPADHFIFSLATVPGFEAQSREKIARICERYSQSDNGRNVAATVDSWHHHQATPTEPQNAGKPEKNPYKANWFKQFSAVFWRSFLTVLRDPVFLFVKGIGSIFLSLLVALLYQGQELEISSAFNIQGVIFLSITNATFETVFAVVSTFSLELPIFLREHRNGMYRTDVYFLCKSFAELFVYVVYPFISFAIPYYIIGLNPEVERFFIAAGIIILVTNTATSFGYMISCLAGTPELALAIAPPMIIPMLLFGGYFLQSGSIPAYLDWIKYLSWFLYANEAMSINQWHDVNFQRTVCQILENITENIPPNLSTIAPPNPDVSLSPLLTLLELLVSAIKQIRDSIICTGEDILDRLNFNPEYFLRDVLCLVALIIGFRLLAFLALLSKTYRK